jgi:hypothetical protein
VGSNSRFAEISSGLHRAKHQPLSSKTEIGDCCVSDWASVMSFIFLSCNGRADVA